MSAQANPLAAAPVSSMMAAPLLAAMTVDATAATNAWNAWRASIDIEHLTWPDMQILPLLSGPRFEEWLAGDPAAGILKGIVRRAWSEAQVRLGIAREVVVCLGEAGCDSVTVLAALGAYLRILGSKSKAETESTAIRPVLELRILISRQHLAIAAAALESDGWQPRDRVPTHDWLDRMSYLYFSRNGARLYLHWRILKVGHHCAAACEREFLSDHRAVPAIGTTFRILSPGHALLEALAERPETVDALAWQAEVAQILSNGEPIDWKRWRKIAARYQPLVFKRLAEEGPALRALGLDIPELRPPRTHKLGQLLWRWLPSARSWARRISAVAGKA